MLTTVRAPLSQNSHVFPMRGIELEGQQYPWRPSVAEEGKGGGAGGAGTASPGSVELPAQRGDPIGDDLTEHVLLAERDMVSGRDVTPGT